MSNESDWFISLLLSNCKRQLHAKVTQDERLAFTDELDGKEPFTVVASVETRKCLPLGRQMKER